MKVTLDARSPIQVIQDKVLFSGANPSGSVLSCNNYYYLKDGKPFFPVMGEIHPMRIDPQFWEDVLIKAKNGGLNTISFYIFWVMVEPAPGVFDFTGRQNIRRFVELCGKHGLYAIPRIGPFCNAEIAHGGLPSWLYGMPFQERSNDEGYLKLVARLYQQIGQQLQGLYWKDGGPIIGLQVENEFGHAPGLWDSFYPFGAGSVIRKGYKGEEGCGHMRRLKKLARDAGMEVPFWTATCWGEAPVPEEEFLPTFGEYTYLGKGGPTNRSCLMTPHESRRTPYTTCELGTGVDVHSPWRPHIPPEGAVVLLFTSLAQGSNGCGFYMYAGGSNPVSRERFYVSDGRHLKLGLISYDFSAPVGEYGMVNDTYRHLRPWLQFVQDYAADFVTTKPVWSVETVEPEDTEHLRYIARTDGEHGYLFISNFQDKITLPERSHVSVEIRLPSGPVQFPDPALLSDGLHIASDEMVMLPFGMQLGSGSENVLLQQASALPFCRLHNAGGETCVFCKTAKMPAVYLFPQETKIASAEDGKISIEEIGAYVRVEAAPDTCFSANGLRILTLDKETVLHTQKAVLPDGREVLLHSPDDFTYEKGKVTLTGFNPQMSLRIWQETEKCWKTRRLQAEHPSVREGLHPELKILNDTWATLKMPSEDFRGLDDIVMELDFEGDLARIFADGLMVADHFNDGRTWRVSLRHLRRGVTCKDGLVIRLFPCEEGEASMLFDGITYKPVCEETGKTAYRSLRILPRYRKTVNASIGQ